VPCHPGAGYHDHWQADQHDRLQDGVGARYAQPDARHGCGYQVGPFPHGGAIRWSGQDDPKQSALVLSPLAWHWRILHQQAVDYPIWQDLTGNDLLLPGADDLYQRGYRSPDVHAGCHRADDYADVWGQHDQQKGAH